MGWRGCDRARRGGEVTEESEHRAVRMGRLGRDEGDWGGRVESGGCGRGRNE